MAISTAIIAFTPSYQQIGIVSVLLIIFARMIQGFSIGGEYNGVLAILSEQAPDNKRGLITAFGTFFSGFGVFLGTVVVFCSLVFVRITNALIWMETMLCNRYDNGYISAYITI